jgi:hypothetical protein
MTKPPLAPTLHRLARSDAARAEMRAVDAVLRAVRAYDDPEVPDRMLDECDYRMRRALHRLARLSEPAKPAAKGKRPRKRSTKADPALTRALDTLLGEDARASVALDHDPDRGTHTVEPADSSDPVERFLKPGPGEGGKP